MLQGNTSSHFQEVRKKYSIHQMPSPQREHYLSFCRDLQECWKYHWVCQVVLSSEEEQTRVAFSYRASNFAKLLLKYWPKVNKYLARRKIVKNRLKSTMGNDWLDHCMLTMSEKGLLEKIDLKLLAEKSKLEKLCSLKV